ncbi:MAG: hypothetical protein AB9866_01875 [Syntrophobacteraceae bacterium]
MKKILIDDCLKNDEGCHKAYSALIDFLTRNLHLEHCDIITISEYSSMDSEQIDDLWRSLHAFCLHAKSTGYTHLLTMACNEGIPVIMVRGEKTDTEVWKVWSSAFRLAGWKNLNPAELCSTGKLFYLEKDSLEILGAARWITDYYYNLKDRAVARAKHEAAYGYKIVEQAAKQTLFDSLR